MAILTLLIALQGALGWFSVDGMIQQEERLGTLLESTILTDKADLGVLDFERLLFNHITDGDSTRMASIEANLVGVEKDVRDSFVKFKELPIPPGIREQIVAVEAELDSYFESKADILRLSTDNQNDKALALLYENVAPVMKSLEVKLDAIVAENTSAYLSMIQSDKAQAGMVTVAISIMTLIAIALAVFLSLFLITMIRKPLTAALSLAEAITRGDLTVKVAPQVLESKDEFGKLMRALNHMQEDLAHSVRQIDNSSEALEQVSGRLGQVLEEAVEAVGAIGQTVEDVNSKVLNQSASVTETSATITQIVKSIEGLRLDIDNQASAVTQSSASIEEMMSNIQSVTHNVEQMGDEFTKLVGASDTGKSKLLTVTDKVRIVSDQSRKLLEANGVIKGIAAQTNLLAMNAAIEAAHAGEAGRGFAVVADEIRKLAEMSAKQSGEISKDIASIMKEITTVVSAAGDSEKAFGVILDEITVLNRYEQEIKQAMLEQSEGSRQILEAIAEINEITSHVKDSATEITEGSKSIRDEMQNLATVSEELNASMHQIEDGTKRIRTTTTQLEEVGQRNTEQISALAGLVTKFTL